MATYKIPLSTGAQYFRVQLGSTTYRFTLSWRDADLGGWFLDIATPTGTDIITGIALVPGRDLLEQYKHLIPTGALYVATDGDELAVPTYDSLGVTTWLYYVA